MRMIVSFLFFVVVAVVVVVVLVVVIVSFACRLDIHIVYLCLM